MGSEVPTTVGRKWWGAGGRESRVKWGKKGWERERRLRHGETTPIRSRSQEDGGGVIVALGSGVWQGSRVSACSQVAALCACGEMEWGRGRAKAGRGRWRGRAWREVGVAGTGRAGRGRAEVGGSALVSLQNQEECGFSA